MYQLIFYRSKKLEKDRQDLLKQPKISEKIQNTLQKLSLNPFAEENFDIKKLKNSGEEGVFRLRVGKYRVIYDIDTSNKVIIIYRIKQRKEGYE